MSHGVEGMQVARMQTVVLVVSQAFRFPFAAGGSVK
jgi:hypothetical protein